MSNGAYNLIIWLCVASGAVGAYAADHGHAWGVWEAVIGAIVASVAYFRLHWNTRTNV